MLAIKNDGQRSRLFHHSDTSIEQSFKQLYIQNVERGGEFRYVRRDKILNFYVPASALYICDSTVIDGLFGLFHTTFPGLFEKKKAIQDIY